MPEQQSEMILLIVQILTFIALTLYVIKTWQIASATEKSTKISEKTLLEMKESREQETDPYVTVSFDIPYGQFLILLAVKNIGKTIAEDIVITFEPELESSEGKEINDIPMIKDGISSLPPGGEIKTLFDSTVSYFNNENLPRTYQSTIKYKGGISDRYRTVAQSIDLSAYEGVSFVSEKGMRQLVKEIEKIQKSEDKISKSLKKIELNMAENFWIQNNELTVFDGEIQNDKEAMEKLKTKLKQFTHIWNIVFRKEKDNFLDPFITNFKKDIKVLGYQIIFLYSILSNSLDEEKSTVLEEIIKNLYLLSYKRFYIDGGKSANEFSEKGDTVIDMISEFNELTS